MKILIVTSNYPRWPGDSTTPFVHNFARELVNRIQNIRKSSGFEITDKIKITISKNTQTDDAVNEYNTYICNQVLGTSLEIIDEVKDGTELSFDDFSLFVNVIKD